MRALVGSLALVIVLGLAGCVTGTAGGGRMSHACTTTITGPDGKPQQAVIEADDAAAAALLCEGDMASDADIARAMLGDGPISKADKVVVRTAGRARPVAAPAPVLAPAPKAAPLPAPVQNRPATVRPAPFGPACGLVMVGGTGYVCSRS